MTEKVDLYSMTIEEITDFVLSIGEKKFRARQIYDGLYSGWPLSQISSLSKDLRSKLSELTLDTLPIIEKKLVSKLYQSSKVLLPTTD